MKLSQYSKSIKSGVLVLSLVSLLILLGCHVPAEDKVARLSSEPSQLSKGIIGIWVLVGTGTPGEVGKHPAALDRIFSAAGLANMDVAQAAFIVMMMATKDMDDDIRLIMTEIRAMTQAKQRLRDLVKELNAWITAEMCKRPGSEDIYYEKITGSSPNRNFKISGKIIEYNEPYADIEDPDLVREMAVCYDLSDSDGVTIEDLRALVEVLRGQLDKMTAMTEMTFLRLQITMDRRSRFISMLSNMMKKISTTQDALIRNIK